MVTTGWSSQVVHDRYDRYMREHGGEFDVPDICESMYLTGYNDGVRSTIAFADVVPLARRMIARLELLVNVLEDAVRWRR